MNPFYLLEYSFIPLHANECPPRHHTPTIFFVTLCSQNALMINSGLPSTSHQRIAYDAVLMDEAEK